jgi:hypothetical protein
VYTAYNEFGPKGSPAHSFLQKTHSNRCTGAHAKRPQHPYGCDAHTHARKYKTRRNSSIIVCSEHIPKLRNSGGPRSAWARQVCKPAVCAIRSTESSSGTIFSATFPASKMLSASALTSPVDRMSSSRPKISSLPHFSDESSSARLSCSIDPARRGPKSTILRGCIGDLGCVFGAQRFTQALDVPLGPDQVGHRGQESRGPLSSFRRHRTELRDLPILKLYIFLVGQKKRQRTPPGAMYDPLKGGRLRRVGLYLSGCAPKGAQGQAAFKANPACTM